MSPTRRLRLLTAQIHRSLVAPTSPTRAELVEAPQYIEALLGPWAVLAWDTEAQVARVARQAWEECTTWSSSSSSDPSIDSASTSATKIDLQENESTYLSHLSRAITAPLSLLQAYAEPSALAAPSSTAASSVNSTAATSGAATPNGAGALGDLRDAKNRDENVEETVEATQARLAAGALGSLAAAFSSQAKAKLQSSGAEEAQGAADEGLGLNESLEYLLHSSQLWSCFLPPSGPSSSHPHSAHQLFSTAESSSGTPLGPQSPAVRTRAWQLVSALLSHRKELLRELLFAPLASAEEDEDEEGDATPSSSSTRGAFILAAAWAERDQTTQRAMLEAATPLLVAFDGLWGFSTERMKDGRDAEDEESEDESEDEDDDDEDEGEDKADGAPNGEVAPLFSSPTYQGFLHWLSAACGEAPAIGFSAILVLASSLRSHLLTKSSQPRAALDELFDHFYAALRARSLDANPMGARAFLSSLCETTVFFARSSLDTAQVPELAEAERLELSQHLVARLFGRLWRDLVLCGAISPEDAAESACLNARVQAMSDTRITQELGKALTSLAGNKEVGTALIEPLLKDVAQATADAVQPSAAEMTLPPTRAFSRVAGVLALLAANAPSESAAMSVIEDLFRICHTSIQQVAPGSSASTPLELLTLLVKELQPQSLRRPVLSQVLQELCETSVASMLLDPRTSVAAAALLAAYLPLTSDAETRNKVWSKVTGQIGSLSSLEEQARVVSALAGPAAQVDAVHDAALDNFALDCVSRIAESIKPVPTAIMKAAEQLMSSPSPFVDANVAAEMLTLTISKLEYEGRQLVSRAVKGEEIDPVTIIPFSAVLELLSHYVESNDTDRRVAQICESDVYRGVIPVVFNLAYLCEGQLGGIRGKAVHLWSSLSKSTQAKQLVLDALQEHLLDILVPLSALENAISVLSGGASLACILPTESSLDLLASEALDRAIPAELSVVDSLVPQDGGEPAEMQGIWDYTGLGPYPRVMWAAQRAAADDTDFLTGRPWILRHLVQLAVALEDTLNLPRKASHLWASNVSHTALKSLLSSITETLTTVVSSAARHSDPGWHKALVQTLKDGDNILEGDLIAQALLDLKVIGTVSATRALSRLLHGVLRFTTADEDALSAWIKFAQSQVNTNASFATAVAAAVRSEAESSPAYARACNETAAQLAGIRPAEASTKGLDLLRYISVLLPSAESDTIFIPQQRSIFLLQALQRWITSEEEIVEELNARIAQLGVTLLPIIQDVPGSHFDFFLDLVESNLEISSLSDSETLPCLHQSLRLLTAMRDVASTNAAVREIWNERRKESLQVIRGLFLSIDDAPPGHSEARDRCIDLILELVTEVPQKMFEDQDSHHLLHRLLLTPRSDVQMVAYRRVSALTKASTADLVVQLALEKEATSTTEETTEQPKEYRLPVDVLTNIANNVPKTLIEEDHAVPYRMHGFLLSWLVVLDHFEGASMQLTSRYMEDLQKRDLVATTLLPSIFKICDNSIFSEALDPSLWSVEEIFLDHIDILRPASLQVLAAHLYFRSLVRMPTLVRTWWYDLRDKQLSAQVERFTVRYCTPLVSSRELQHLTQSDALSRLQDESMAVKVLSTNEVVATYTVDEHPMEIAIKIPRDFPLHGVEIKDIKRVGVSEAQWRAWILAVQQLITSRNGLIFDALMLFKKNAEAKFAGYEGAECESAPSRQFTVRIDAERLRAHIYNPRFQALSATRSSARRISRCRTSRARLARTSSMDSVCTSGSAPLAARPARYADPSCKLVSHALQAWCRPRTRSNRIVISFLHVQMKAHDRLASVLLVHGSRRALVISKAVSLAISVRRPGTDFEASFDEDPVGARVVLPDGGEEAWWPRGFWRWSIWASATQRPNEGDLRTDTGRHEALACKVCIEPVASVPPHVGKGSGGSGGDRRARMVHRRRIRDGAEVASTDVSPRSQSSRFRLSELTEGLCWWLVIDK